MREFALFLILISTICAPAQSGRSIATDVPIPPGTPVTPEQTVKQMFDEANGYIRKKGNEFDAKKVPFSERLFAQAKLEQRLLAAKLASIAAIRKDLVGEDFYNLGMLNWIAENLDGTSENLRKFTASENAAADRTQTARSIIVVIAAKQKKFEDAEKMLAEYLAHDPKKLTERARMEGEMAKAYQSQKDFVRMAPHADEGYAASKGLLKNAASRARGLDEILDAGMLVYEAYRDGGNRRQAEAGLDDMRATAVATGSTSFYYYAVDQKIKYLVETGRKPTALQLYKDSMTDAVKDFPRKDQQEDVLTRLRKREQHYKLLGETAPELPMIEQWFPGKARTLAEMKGKVVLLDFWATWCGPCFEAFPDLIEWQQDFSSDGLQILGVTRYYGTIGEVAADTPSEIEYFKQFREKEKLPYDFVVIKDQSAQILYGATALPTAVIIDRKGIIRYIETGTSATRQAEMHEMIVKLLAEK